VVVAANDLFEEVLAETELRDYLELERRTTDARAGPGVSAPAAPEGCSDYFTPRVTAGVTA
jgi:hypothetical protein